MIAQGRAGASPTPLPAGAFEKIAGSRGGKGVGDVPIHSVRLPGFVASQEVIFGGLGQTLTLRHDSRDRKSFMPGVILALRHAPALAAGGNWSTGWKTCCSGQGTPKARRRNPEVFAGGAAQDAQADAGGCPADDPARRPVARRPFPAQSRPGPSPLAAGQGRRPCLRRFLVVVLNDGVEGDERDARQIILREAPLVGHKNGPGRQVGTNRLDLARQVPVLRLDGRLGKHLEALARQQVNRREQVQ